MVNIYTVRQKGKTKRIESPKMNVNKTPRNRTPNDPLTLEEANLLLRSIDNVPDHAVKSAVMEVEV